MNSSWLKNALSKKVLIKDIICTIGEGAVKPGDAGGGGETFWCRKTLWSNRSKRASAWPGYPDTEKQMKAWVRRPSAFIVSSMNQQNPVFPTRVYPTCNQQRMILIFLTIMFLLVGFILTSVGVWVKETLLPVPPSPPPSHPLPKTQLYWNRWRNLLLVFGLILYNIEQLFGLRHHGLSTTRGPMGYNI